MKRFSEVEAEINKAMVEVEDTRKEVSRNYYVKNGCRENVES